MTPKQAILKQCRFCMNANIFRGCNSEYCNLNDSSFSNLKKTKRHCITCIPEQSVQGVRKCSGEILNPEPHKCSLHPYRLGHNPRRKGIGGKNINSRPLFLTERR